MMVVTRGYVVIAVLTDILALVWELCELLLEIKDVRFCAVVPVTSKRRKEKTILSIFKRTYAYDTHIGLGVRCYIHRTGVLLQKDFAPTISYNNYRPNLFRQERPDGTFIDILVLR